MKPHSVTKYFEAALCEYTGAKYAVAVSSCTSALFLSLKWYFQTCYYNPCSIVSIPKFTYNSVPMQIIQAGGMVKFHDEDWKGEYQLKNTNIWDSARRFTNGMYRRGQMQCVSFHSSKILGDSQGGAILHDNEEADKWFRRARFDGRTEGVAPKDDKFIMGWHAYMSPDVSARLLWRLSTLPKHNADLPNSDYCDLSQQECFKS